MASKGSKTRRHHYISACYLKNFASPRDRTKGRLWSLDKEGKRQWPSTPEGVGHERDFNRFEAKGLHSNVIEDMLGEGIENDFPRVISYVEGKHRLPKPNGELYSILITMAALFAVRHPSMRKKMEEFIKAQQRQKLRLMVSSEERWESITRRMREDGYHVPEGFYEQMRSFVEEERYDINFPVGYHIKTEFELQETVFPLLYRRKWELMVHNGEAEFITSSAPISLIATTPELAGMPLGYGLRTTAAIFPLTPKLCAFGTFEGRFRTRQVDALEVAEVNGITATSECRFLYSRQKTFSFLTIDGDQTQDAFL